MASLYLVQRFSMASAVWKAGTGRKRTISVPSACFSAMMLSEFLYTPPTALLLKE